MPDTVTPPNHRIEATGPDTPERLLRSAVEVFAGAGFHGATVAEICRRADANIAAVNYHFGGKEQLYREAWRAAFARSLAAHPLSGGVPANAPAEERLRGHILGMIRRIADPRSHEFDIIRHERGTPTGLLAEITRDCIRPVRAHMTAIVGELLGPRATEREVELCQRSIMGQCLHLALSNRHEQSLFATDRGPPTLEDGARHIVRFSLAGIRDLRRSLETGGEHAET